MALPLIEVDELFQKSWDTYKPRIGYYALLMLAQTAISFASIIAVLTVLALFLYGAASDVGQWIGKLLNGIDTVRPALNQFVALGAGFLVFLIIIALLGSWLRASQWIAITESGTTPIGQVLKRGFSLIPRYFALEILLNIIIGAGTIFFIVPGILFSGWFMFTSVLAVKNSPIESLKMSRKLVVGRWWAIVGRMILAAMVAVVIPQIISMFTQNTGTTYSSLLMTGVAVSILVGIFRVFFLNPWYLVYKKVLCDEAEKSLQPNNPVLTN